MPPPISGRASSTCPCLSEDFFRYGAAGARVNPPALLALLASLRRLPGLRLLQIDHANVSSIARFSDDELHAVHELLVGGNRHDYLWVNVGDRNRFRRVAESESAARRKWGRPARTAGAELCAEQLRRLCRAGFFPFASLMIGLPGEREEDLRCTLEWVREMRRERLAIFPMLLAPLGAQRAATSDITRLQWQLIRESYVSNFHGCRSCTGIISAPPAPCH